MASDQVSSNPNFSSEDLELLEYLVAGDGEAAAPAIGRRGDAARLPLSFAQQRLWFLNQMEPGSPFYNVPAALRLSGTLDIEALRRVFEEIAARHEVLRTTFVSVDGEPRQVIHPRSPWSLPVRDLSHLEQSARESELRKLAGIEACLPFDLATGPLLRTQLLRCGPSEYVLLVNMHHIASDGWSIAVLVKEIAALYGAFAQGRPSPFSELPIQYADFAEWQRARLAGGLLESQLEYWRGRLNGLPALELPTDRPRAHIQTYRGSTESFSLPPSLVERFHLISRSEGATLFMSLLAGFDILLARYSGKLDIAVGMPVANRTQPEMEGLIGFFVNTLVVRSDLSGNPPFRELLRRVRGAALEAYDHQDLPFERIVEDIQGPRDSSRTPVFQVMFTLQNLPAAELSLPGLSLERLDLHTGTSKFDLTLYLSEGAGGLHGAFEYNSDLFDAPTIRCMARQYQTLLNSIAAGPDPRIAELEIVSAEERFEVMRWNDTSTAFPREATVQRLFEEQVEQRGNAVALEFGERTTSYRELNDRANRLAHHLRRLGVKTEDRVGICVKTVWEETVVGMLGILKAGGAYVPLDASYPVDRLGKMLRDSGAVALVTERGLLEEIEGIARVYADYQSAAECHSAPLWGEPENLAYVMYTSGSSGEPKGIGIPHRAIVRLVRNTNYVELGPEDVVLQASNVSFDAATFEVWGALLNGGRLVGMKREDALTPHRYAEEVVRRGVTTVFVTTALFNQIVEANPRTFAGVRNVLFGGQAIDPQWPRLVVEERTTERLLHVYGPTECTTFAAWYHIAEVAEDAVTVPIGRALGNTTLYVLDEEMRMAPVGALGELYIGGEGLARGYHGKAGMTAERFVPDAVSGESGARLYRTGDLVRRRWDGEIEFLGRLDQQVKLRGFRIELGEIEAVIGGHPEVRHSAVMLRGEGGEEPRLVGYVVVERGRQVERERVEEWQRLYEELYGKEGKEESFNIVGWNSSYTGEAIAAEEMREWREETVRRIRSLGGKRIWELGCGTGLLLLELAGRCEEYFGTDFAEAGLAGLKEEVGRRGLKSVRLERREADDFKGVEAGRFDGVVVNSAVQYFPGMEYLEGVLKGAVEAVRDGGWVMVGDVRNLELLGAFQASVEMYRSGSGEKVEEVGDRVRRRIWEEEELVVSPEYFYGLAERWERVRQVEVEVKRGRGGNEMTRYRYEVVLAVGAGEAENVEVEARVKWVDVGGRLERWLEESSAGVVEVEGIPNSRVAGDEWAWRAMEGGAKGSVGELRGSAMEAAAGAVDPESLWEMGERHGWDVRVRWSAEDAGYVDLLVEKKSSGRRGWRRSQKKGAEGNQPLRARQERQLGEELKRYLEKRLPEYMIPVSYVVLESLPLTVNGKVDKRRLPAPERWKRIDKSAKVRPGSAEEEVLAGIWRSVLGVEEVGVEEDFFELGGHSLMATRVVARIGRELGVEVGVRELFEAPTVRGLARRMEELRRGGKSGEQPAIVRVDRGGRLPLSYAQQRLWFVKQLVGEDVHYNMPAAFRLRGALDVEVLRRSLSEMVRRHESLRTRFENHGGEPWQVIEESWEVELPVVEVRAGNEERVRELLEAEAGRPFDLERGPVFRTMVVRLGEEEHILSMTAHHIVFDGWSIGVFIGELASLYEGGVLEELEIQYADYAVWQRGWLQGRVLEEQMGYWRRQLGGMERLELPVDRARRRMQRLKGAKVEVALGGALVEGLRRLGRRESSTLYMVMLAGFQGLLGRYSGQTDIAVGSPIANRRRGEVEKLIGFFVNTLVLRTNLAGDLGFVELLRRVREVALGAYAHQDVPFEQMVEELQPERDLSRNPLVQVIFALQNAPGGSLKLRGLKVEPVRMEWGSVRFDLEVQLWEEGEEIRGYLAYDADLYEEGTIRRMAGHYRQVLEEIVESPERRVSEWELVSGWERRQLLEEWNGEVRQGSREGTIQGRFEEQVERASEAVALEYEGERVSYGELNGRANQVGHWLRERGVGPEVRVGICVERSVEQVVGLLGILKAGGAYVPLDPGYPEERLEYMVEDAGIGVLVTERRQRGKLRVPAGVAVLEMDGDAEELARMARTTVRVQIDSDNLAYVIYTSGSTGRPKGAGITHRNLTRLMSSTEGWFHFDHTDVWTLFHSYSFDFSVWELWGALCYGGRLVVVPYLTSRSPEAFHALLADCGVTVLNQTPSAFHQLMAADAEPHAAQLPFLRLVIFGGEALQPQSLAPWFERHPETRPLLVNMYGITETTVHVTYAPLESSRLGLESNIGRPIPDLQIHVLDGNGRITPIGVPGEMFVGGAGLARGYLDRPSLTAQRFLPDHLSTVPGARLYRTGDLARWRADGTVEYLGRGDHQVKVRGFRIELGEIESVLDSHPAVEKSVVVAREDTLGGKTLAGYVISNLAGMEKAVGQPQQFFAEQIAEWQTLYDETYGRTPADAAAAFNTTGWNSSYTGQPIPSDEMQRWRDFTTGRIRRLQPESVWEIGCGTGLLLFELAPGCRHYFGTDFSQVALDKVRHEAGRLRLSQVELSKRLADDFTGIEAARFDTVVLNSVIQYFSSLDYLREVIRGAVRATAPGGAVFVGDVRSLPLLEAAHTSVALYQAPARGGLADIRQHVKRSLADEHELVVDPRFFAALQGELPEIAGVEVLLKRGTDDNEMTRYRYDVVLHVGTQKMSIFPVEESLRWEDTDTLKDLESRLSRSAALRIEVLGVANRRVFADFIACELLRQSSGIAGDLLQRCRDAASHAQQPEIFWELGERLGYSVQVTWSRSGGAACFDVLFDKSGAAATGVWESMAVSPGNTALANNPLRRAQERLLVPVLGDYLREKLPDYMVPAGFSVLDSFPLTANGKLDRQALPDLVQSRANAPSYVPPASRTELELVRIWEQLLQTRPIGVTDNFFHLGGHSLLAVRLVAMIKERLHKSLPLAELFREGTIRALARELESEAFSNVSSPLVALQPAGSLPAFFCVHPGGGTVFCYWDLASYVGDDLPFYGLQARAVDSTGELPAFTVESLARDYIATIRAIQPEGPYQIGGWSFGGLVAFEMARLLQEDGSRVPVLALLDAIPSEALPPDRHDDAAVLAFFAKENSLPVTEDELRQLSDRDRLVRIVELATQASLLPPGTGPEYVRRFLNLNRLAVDAAEAYRPAPYPGRISLFRACEPLLPEIAALVARDPTCGWQQYTPWPVEIYSVPGDHLSMMKPPHARELARLLRRVLSHGEAFNA